MPGTGDSVSSAVEVEVSSVVSIDVDVVSDMDAILVIDIVVFAESVADGSVPKPEPQTSFQDKILPSSPE